MPRAAPKFRLVNKSKKEEHRQVNLRRSKESTKYYKTARWLKLRKLVLADQPICVTCNKKVATDVDHIDGNSANMEMENLQGLCKSCHSRKTAKENGGFGNKKQPQNS